MQQPYTKQITHIIDDWIIYLWTSYRVGMILHHNPNWRQLIGPCRRCLEVELSNDGSPCSACHHLSEQTTHSNILFVIRLSCLHVKFSMMWPIPCGLFHLFWRIDSSNLGQDKNVKVANFSSTKACSYILHEKNQHNLFLFINIRLWLEKQKLFAFGEHLIWFVLQMNYCLKFFGKST